MSFRLAILVLAAFWISVLAPSPTTLNGQEPSFKEKVQRLVEQLADPDEKKQEEAAAALFKLGPDILPHLPTTAGKLKPAQARHVVALGRALREAKAKKDLAPKLVTLQGSFSLSKALEELDKQTGIKIEDRRREKEDPRLKLDLEQVTFWQALDAITREADLQIYLYRDSGIALVDGPHVAVPVSYNGIFRVALKRLVAVRELETNAHFYVARMEVAWEPRFRPFLIDTRPQALVVKDDRDRELPVPEEGGGKAPVESPFATNLDLRLPAPPRSVNRLNVLKGNLAVVGPSKMLEFTFDTLDVLEKDAKAREQTQESVTVRITRPNLTKGARLLKLEVTLEYPPDGPDFESFQSWLVNNDIYLLKPATNDRFPNNAGYASDAVSKNRASLQYNFVEEKKLPFGNPGDWKVVYRTPGSIAEVPVPFEFKDVPLP
jgi:hypothetical protein